jgi:hypothetical protein
MKVFTLEEKNKSFTRQTRTLPDTGNQLKTMYEILQCEIVDMREFEYKGQIFDVWFDEEFLLNENPNIVTLILGELKPNAFTTICGNLLFAKHNDEGETVGLTEDEIRLLWEFTDINSIKVKAAFARKLL